MDINTEFEIRTRFEKEHSRRPLTDAEAQTLAMADRDFARRYREAQWTHAAHVPPVQQARVTYEQALAEVDSEVRKSAGSLRPDMWVTVLKRHQGQPDQRDYEEAYRQYVLYQQADDLSQAAIEATPFQPLTKDEIVELVKAMPKPVPGEVDTSVWRLR
jgi:hypothetical protein